MDEPQKHHVKSAESDTWDVVCVSIQHNGVHREGSAAVARGYRKLFIRINSFSLERFKCSEDGW